MTARSLLGLLLACLAVFGGSFAAARVANGEEDTQAPRPTARAAKPTVEPSPQELALGAAADLPDLRERPRPKPEPKPAPAARPPEPAAPAPAEEPLPAPSSADAPPPPAPEPAPVVPQQPAPEPAPSGGDTTTFYDGG